MQFFREGLKNLRTTGTVTPSSRFLCQSMIKGIDFSEARILVELGAGDGVVTRHILAKMHPDACLLVFEVQASFCEILRNIKDDRLVVIEDSAEHLLLYLAKYGHEKADHIISAIPFVVLPKETAESIIATCHASLAPRGYYVQMHYSTILRSLYESVFPEVKIKFTPLNIPPAFVFHCSK